MEKTLNVLDFEKSIAELDRNIAAFQSASSDRHEDYQGVVEELRSTRSRLISEKFTHLTAWDKVLLARHQSRPYTLDYIKLICEDYVELRGDRHVGDDQAIVGGPALIDDIRVMIIGQQKGRDLKERQLRNFGYPRPEGYRKALRLMKMAERLKMPVITLIDNLGADTNLHSEEHAISEAIALNIYEMSILRTPIVSVIIGEGGSGGALGLAVADRVLMFEHSTYSVIPPEGCAAILDTFGRDAKRGSEAAIALRVTSLNALELGIIDDILPEPLGGAHVNYELSAATLKAALLENISALSLLPQETLLQQRYEKYRHIGTFTVK